MKWLIGLLTAVTGIFHLLYGLGIGVVGGAQLNWLLLLNGVGYLVLLWLFWTATGSRRGTIRWILLAYTVLTVIGYFVLNGAGAWQYTTGLVIKAIELLLIILLFLDRGRDAAPVAAPAPAASRSGAAVTSTAYQSAAGAGSVTTAGPIGAAAVADMVAGQVDATVDEGDRVVTNVEADLAGAAADAGAWGAPTTANIDMGMGAGVGTVRLDSVTPDYRAEEVVTGGDVVEEAAVETDTWLDRAGDRVGDAVDSAGDAVGDAVAATGAALGAAGAWVGDKLDDAGDAAGDAVGATGEAMSDAGAWVGDRVEDMGDAAGDAVDATGEAMSDAGAWVGDRVEDMGDAAGDAVGATGEAMSDAGDWVGDKLDDAGDATGDAVDATGEAMSDAGAWVGDRVEDMGDAAGDAVDATGEAMSDAGDWVGDKLDDAGDATGGAVDATGEAMSDAGAWVGDRVEDMGDAAGDAVDATGEAMSDAGMAMGATAGATAGAMSMDERAAPAEPSAAQLRSELEEYLRSFGSGSEFRKGVEYIEGIGPAFGEKLRAAGVVTVLDLMVEGATRMGRKHLSERSGLSASQILTWVNHIDLFRIKGVAEEYADLLEQSGVDTVVELAQRNPNNLFKRMIDINEQKQLVRRTPHLSDVQSWVEQAKGLKRLIHY